MRCLKPENIALESYRYIKISEAKYSWKCAAIKQHIWAEHRTKAWTITRRMKAEFLILIHSINIGTGQKVINALELLTTNS